MTIYAPVPPAFTCAICGADWTYQPWKGFGHDLPIPPLCRRCTENWGRSSIGGYADRNRDRRIMRQISALAEAITVEAYRIERNMGSIYGRA